MAEVPPGRRSGAHRYLYDELVLRNIDFSSII